MTTDNDPVLAAWLIERFGAEGEASGLIGEDLVVGYAEGRLSDEERDAAEQLLARDPAARQMLGLVPHETMQEEPAARRSWFAYVAAAAAVLLAIGAFFWTQGDDLPSDREERLVALVQRLPISDQTRAAMSARMTSTRPLDLPAVERGGVHVLAPRGAVLTSSPMLRWRSVTGAADYTVRIARPDDSSLFTATISDLSLALPAELEDGLYIFEVTAKTAFGEAGGSTLFRVVGPAIRAEHAGVVAAIRETASGTERELLTAWYALTKERYGVATAALERAQQRDATDPHVVRLGTLLEPLLP